MGSGILADFVPFFARAAILLVSVAGFCFSFIIVAMITFARPGAGPVMIPVAGGVLFLLYGLSVTIHEFGHAAAARLVGWRVHLIAVGPFGYLPRRRQFVRTRPAQRKHRRGWVISTPPIGPEWDKGRAALFVGGTAANLLCSAVCFTTLVLFTVPVFPYGMIYAFGVISAVMAVGNLIPSRANDGARLLSVAMGNRTSQFEADNAWMVGYTLDGLDRSEWEPNLLHRLRVDAVPDSQGVANDFVLLDRYLALGDVERAHALLEHSALVHDNANFEVVFTRAFLVAIVERDAGKAERLFCTVPTETHGRSHNYWRAKMTIHALRNEAGEAKAAAKEVRRFARKEGALLDRDELALLGACESGEPPPPGIGQVIV